MNTCWRNWRTFGTPSSISWKRSPPSADVILRLDAYRFLARQVFKEQLGAAKRRNWHTFGTPPSMCGCVLLRPERASFLLLRRSREQQRRRHWHSPGKTCSLGAHKVWTAAGFLSTLGCTGPSVPGVGVKTLEHSARSSDKLQGGCVCWRPGVLYATRKSSIHNVLDGFGLSNGQPPWVFQWLRVYFCISLCGRLFWRGTCQHNNLH